MRLVQYSAMAVAASTLVFLANIYIAGGMR